MIQRAGHGGRHVLILVDGIRPANSAFDPRSIATSAIERIEVLPAIAPTVATYGVEASDGLINFVMKRDAGQKP